MARSISLLPSDGSARNEHVDSVESALLQARALIDSTISTHRSLSARSAPPGEACEDEEVGDLIMRLVDRCERRITATVTESEAHAEVIMAALMQRCRKGRGGIAVRLLGTPKALESSLLGPAVSRLSGCETRVVPADLDETLVVDGRVALVRAELESVGSCSSILEDPAAARALELMLANIWQTAMPPEEYQRLDGLLREDTSLRVLRSLCAGSTDAVAAREMQVSLRTYRRRVAEIMLHLGVSSRFQAGVRAVELRLVSECG